MTSTQIELQLHNYQLWAECPCELMQSREEFNLSIYLNRTTLYDAFLCIQKQRNSPILCCLPINSNMEFMIDMTHLVITLNDYDKITIIFVMEQSKEFEKLLCQICKRMNQIPNNSISNNSLHTLNLSFLLSIQIPYQYLELLTNGTYIKLKPNFSFATPIFDSAPQRQTWEKRIYTINSNYLTSPKTFRVTFFTWNVASIKPKPTVLDEIIKAFHNGTGKADIVFVALQEIDMGVVSVVSGSSKVKEMWSTVIHAAVDFWEGEYKVAAESTLGGIYASVIIRTNQSKQSGQLIDLSDDYIEPVVSDVKTIRLGAHGLAANKGTIIFFVKVGITKFIFMGCHLTPHQDAWEDRNQQLIQLMKQVDGMYDYLAIIGDLNYRIDLSYEDCISLIKQNEVDKLIGKDQLSISKQSDSALSRLKEPKMSFLPTYKFDKDSDVYDSSEKHRVPSYTDRILLKRGRKRLVLGNSDNQTEPTFNELDKPVMNFPSMPKCTDFRRGNCRFSDHRAVFCAYKFQIPKVNENNLALFAEKIYADECDNAEFLVPKIAINPKQLVFNQKGEFVELKIRNVSKSWVKWQFNGIGTECAPKNGVVLPNYTSVLKIKILEGEQIDQCKAELTVEGGKNVLIPMTLTSQ